MAANITSIHAKIDPQTKRDAKRVLDELGLSMTEAISLYFRQVVLRRGIPFEISIPNKVTASTLRKSKKGEELHEVSDVDELMQEISE